MAFSLHTAVEGEVKVELHDISQQIHSFYKSVTLVIKQVTYLGIVIGHMHAHLLAII